jgi:tRNA/rRNA methyltransferase/tRNA (cytidine32/uridine32-2'-O)-methyltransferase
MKNMGLSELRLADPQLLDVEKVQVLAVHAMDIWENALRFNTLAESVKDCSIVVGTTRRRGHHRKSVSMEPHALAAWLAERPGPCALVFGSERTGLEEAELDLCNFASHVPVSDVQPSLNLSHAVQIYAYELFLALKERQPVKGQWQAMNQAEIAALVDSITETLESVGFYRNPVKEEQSRFLRDVIARAGLADREAGYLKDILIKAARLGSQSN